MRLMIKIEKKVVVICDYSYGEEDGFIIIACDMTVLLLLSYFATLQTLDEDDHVHTAHASYEIDGQDSEESYSYGVSLWYGEEDEFIMIVCEMTVLLLLLLLLSYTQPILV